jgi:hypothetical protein
MAQAPAVNTDELLSQLAASEIDRLLAEADGKPPTADEPPEAAPVVTEGPERAALLQAAGFQATTAPADPAAGQPTGDERSALLKAAGFESAGASEPPPPPPVATLDEVLADDSDRPPPIYLKPLVWISSPLDACPSAVRQMLGRAGLLTLVNALAVLTYVYFFRKH